MCLTGGVLLRPLVLRNILMKIFRNQKILYLKNHLPPPGFGIRIVDCVSKNKKAEEKKQKLKDQFNMTHLHITFTSYHF